MLYDLMESDQLGVTLYKTVDFPEVTLDMHEDGLDDQVLEEWLDMEDMDSLTTHFFFQNPREEDFKELAFSYDELRERFKEYLEIYYTEEIDWVF